MSTENDNGGFVFEFENEEIATQSPADKGMEYEDVSDDSPTIAEEESSEPVAVDENPTEEKPKESAQAEESSKTEEPASAIARQQAKVSQLRELVSDVSLKIDALKLEMKCQKKSHDLFVDQLRDAIAELQDMIEGDDQEDDDQPADQPADQIAEPQTEVSPQSTPDINEYHQKLMATPIDDLPWKQVKGFGQKKRELLFAECKTFGELERFIGEKGLTSLDGFGEELENRILDMRIEFMKKMELKQNIVPVSHESEAVTEAKTEPVEQEPPQEPAVTEEATATTPETFDINDL